MNAYLREISGQPFTAKDFRTWTGTVLAAMALKGLDAFDTATKGKKNIVAAVETVAKRLGNTPSVCRKCYIHPEILNAYLDGDLVAQIGDAIEDCMDEVGLSADELCVLSFLKSRLEPRAAAE